MKIRIIQSMCQSGNKFNGLSGIMDSMDSMDSMCLTTYYSREFCDFAKTDFMLRFFFYTYLNDSIK